MQTDRRIFWILIGLWAATYFASIVVIQTTEPTGGGFTHGLNRLTAFLSWQIFAAAVAVGVWIAGNRLPKGSQIRLLSRIPALLATVLIAIIAGALIYANANKPLPT